MLGTLEARPMVFDFDEIARAGAFVSIDGAGALKVERGYVRPEDELPILSEPEAEVESDAGSDEPDYAASYAPAGGSAVHGGPEPAPEPEEEDGIKPLPDRLLTELTAHRTLALRNAIGEQPEVAFLAVLLALCLKLFYGYGLNSCLELDVKSVTFNAQAPGLNDTAVARTLTDRHQFWLASMPKHPEDLWTALSRLDEPSRRSLTDTCLGPTSETCCGPPSTCSTAQLIGSSANSTPTSRRSAAARKTRTARRYGRSNWSGCWPRG